LCGGGPVKDTANAVAKRILDRDDAARTIEVQSEGEESPSLEFCSSVHPIAALRHPSIRTFGGPHWGPVHFRILHQRRCDLDGGFLPGHQMTGWNQGSRAVAGNAALGRLDLTLLAHGCCAMVRKPRP
jgi:hypothetical protein